MTFLNMKTLMHHKGLSALLKIQAMTEEQL